jgi:hypothetical protein
MNLFSRFSFLLVLVVFISYCYVIEMKPAGTNRQDRAWKMKKTSCEEDACSHLIKDEAYNCVNNCTSADCFSQIYAETPLEDGEIDTDRNRQFISCLRKESRMLQVILSRSFPFHSINFLLFLAKRKNRCHF